LFNRKNGLNILIDEARVSEDFWATAPRQISIALTNSCDLSCAFCYAPKSRASLNSSTVIDWLWELGANGCFSIGFGGGEPTLYRDFHLLCRYASKSTKLAVTFTTHAHRIDDELAAKLQGNVHFIRISMDGVGQTYEAIRGRPFAALKSRMETIRALAPFGINYVVNARTLPDLDTAVELSAQMGAREFLLLPEQRAGGGNGIDPETAQALLDWVWQYRGPIPLTISEASSDGMPACSPIPSETGLQAYAHIDATGLLKASSYAHGGVLVGQGGVMKALGLLRSQHQE
jgi:sulfatase maturation enzyme AslB (radical SAM superfamily)